MKQRNPLTFRAEKERSLTVRINSLSCTLQYTPFCIVKGIIFHKEMYMYERSMWINKYIFIGSDKKGPLINDTQRCEN